MALGLSVAKFFHKNLKSKSLLDIPFLLSFRLKIPQRTTYILRRRVEPPEYPKHVETEKIYLEDIHHEYLVVEQVDEKPRESIKIVLTEFVEDVGKRGQIVEVDPIDGYMHYLLTGRGVYPTPENIAKQRMLSEVDIIKHSSISAYKAGKILKSRTLSVFMSMHEPWTIQPWHIRVMLRQNGVHMLSDSSIRLPENSINGPNLRLEGKDFAVTITINNCEVINIRCRLRHWTRIYSEKIILPSNHECVPSDPIFPEQKELLDTIPLPIWEEEIKRS